MAENRNNQENDDFREEFGDKLMNHDYDGIKELDNPAPKWIMAIFYVSIVFSLYYFVYYFIMDGPTQDEEYIEVNIEHEKKYNAKGDGEVFVLLTDEASIKEGEILYKEMNCGACHGANGEGNAVGPNLADNAWIHGCDFESVFDVIKNGKSSKGMTAFKNQMPDGKIQKVTSYLLSKLVNSNPENAKESQGEECK